MTLSTAYVSQSEGVLQLGPFSLSPTELHLTHNDSTTLQVTASLMHKLAYVCTSLRSGATVVGMHITGVDVQCHKQCHCMNKCGRI